MDFQLLVSFMNFLFSSVLSIILSYFISISTSCISVSLVDLNLELAGRELENILPDIITDFYISQNLTARDLAQRPKWQIEKDIKTILQWGIRDLANQGWDTDD